MISETFLEIIFIIFIAFIYYYLKNTLPSYLKEKSKNLATKEDIEEITNKVESIKHDYNRQLEEFKQELLIKHKAEIIAELLAEWLAKPTDKKRLNELSFQAFLWLPDDICNELSDVLAHNTNYTTFREIIQKTRQHLLKETNLEAWKVVYFPTTTTPQGEKNEK